MKDYIEYIIYGIVGVFVIIGLIVKIRELIYKVKYTSFRFINLLEYIPDVLKLVYFSFYTYSLYCVSTLESIVDIIICGIVLIPVMFYLGFIKPDKDKELKKLEDENKRLKDELENIKEKYNEKD